MLQCFSPFLSSCFNVCFCFLSSSLFSAEVVFSFSFPSPSKCFLSPFFFPFSISTYYDTFTNHLSTLLLPTIGLLAPTIFIITLLLTALISSLLFSLLHGPAPPPPPPPHAPHPTPQP